MKRFAGEVLRGSFIDFLSRILVAVPTLLLGPMWILLISPGHDWSERFLEWSLIGASVVIFGSLMAVTYSVIPRDRPNQKASATTRVISNHGPAPLMTCFPAFPGRAWALPALPVTSPAVERLRACSELSSLYGSQVSIAESMLSPWRQASAGEIASLSLWIPSSCGSELRVIGSSGMPKDRKDFAFAIPETWEIKPDSLVSAAFVRSKVLPNRVIRHRYGWIGTDPHFASTRSLGSTVRYRCNVALPIPSTLRSGVVGVLMVDGRSFDTFDDSELVSGLQRFALLLAPVVEVFVAKRSALVGSINHPQRSQSGSVSDQKASGPDQIQSPGATEQDVAL